MAERSADAPPSPRRRPQQSRSRELVRAIREAGLAILAEQGAVGLTTNRIAERAGVGIASLYRYYPDKEAILADLFDEKVRIIDQFYRDTIAGQSLDALPLREKVHHLVATPVAISRDLLALHRDFFQHHHLRFEISYRHGPDGERSWVEWAEAWWRQMLAADQAALRVADLDIAAKVSLAAARGAIDTAIARYPEVLEQPAFAEALEDMVCRYLLPDSPSIAAERDS